MFGSPRRRLGPAPRLRQLAPPRVRQGGAALPHRPLDCRPGSWYSLCAGALLLPASNKIRPCLAGRWRLPDSTSVDDLQPAIAGRMSFRGSSRTVVLGEQVALKAGSHATGRCEPGQGRNAAAISIQSRVPWVLLAGVNCMSRQPRAVSTLDCTAVFLTQRRIPDQLFVAPPGQ